MSIITVKDVTKKFHNKVTAVNRVSLQISPKKFYVITGPSGSGKTTLLSLMGLLDQPSEGKILINGTDTSLLSSDEKASIRMKGIGFVFQDFHLNETLKAYENVMLPMFINREIDKTDLYHRARYLLKKVGLEERINHFPRQLSGGEKQRVAIARALANDPGVILADEPTGNLDMDTETRILKFFKRLSELGYAVVMVSHSQNVKQYADQVFSVEGGMLRESTI